MPVSICSPTPTGPITLRGVVPSIRLTVKLDTSTSIQLPLSGGPAGTNGTAAGSSVGTGVAVAVAEGVGSSVTASRVGVTVTVAVSTATSCGGSSESPHAAINSVSPRRTAASQYR